MLTIIESPTRPKALALVNLVFDAALSDPVPPSKHRANRRFFKLYEEMGEASQAHLAVTGSNTKKLSYTDLDIELGDVFIVYVDLLLTWLRLVPEKPGQGGNVEALRHALANHLDLCLLEPYENAVGPRLSKLFKVVADAHEYLEQPPSYAYTRLLQGLESLFLLVLQDSRPDEAQRDTPEERLDIMLSIVQRKTEKWKSIRTSND